MGFFQGFGIFMVLILVTAFICAIFFLFDDGKTLCDADDYFRVYSIIISFILIAVYIIISIFITRPESFGYEKIQIEQEEVQE